jgi:hypothetical protein
MSSKRFRGAASYTVAYLTIPLLIINNNRDIIDFPRRFLMTSVLSFTREKAKRNKEH